MSRRRWSRVVLGVVLVESFLASGLQPVAAETAGGSGLPSLVLLVRHGEKGSHQGEDPALTPAGRERAQALAATLRYAGVTAIVTTQLRRTRETAEPLARELGLVPEVVPVRTDWTHIDDYSLAVVTALRRHPGGTVLVVGHQNTVAPVIADLGGPRLRDICDPAFGNLYILIPGPGAPRLVLSHYGAPDPPGRCE